MELQILTKEDIKRQAPVVLADKPTRKVSDHYTFVDNEVVIDDMEKLGWYPTQVSQRSRRSGVNSKFSPHLIKFSNPDLRIITDTDDISYPQILLQNRHDGLGSFKFSAGVYRLVCSNGLIIATASFGEFKVHHRGYDFSEIRQMVEQRTLALPEQVNVMNDMKERMLTKEERRELAFKGLFLRSRVSTEKEKEFRGQIDLVTLEDILEPIRPQDAGPDLWNTYQVVQEKMIKGGFHTQLGMEGKVRKVKPIKSFLSDLDLNKGLFDEAVVMLEN